MYPRTTVTESEQCHTQSITSDCVNIRHSRDWLPCRDLGPQGHGLAARRGGGGAGRYGRGRANAVPNRPLSASLRTVLIRPVLEAAPVTARRVRVGVLLPHPLH